MSQRTATIFFAVRFVLWLLLVLLGLVVRFQRAVKLHGFTGAVLLFAFAFLVVELLMRGDQRLRHRMGIRWASRLYSIIMWVTVAALLLAALLIVM
jgi:hypothetical protein